MTLEIPVRIILQSPPPGVDFGLQKGKGNKYEIIQKQRSDKVDLLFECKISVKNLENPQPDFAGPFVQGPVNERFIYIGIGAYAGQQESVWSRRLKIPLRDIPLETINNLLNDSGFVLQASVPGTGKDGGPNCATVKPFVGWHLTRI
ncbi:MAG: DUF5990 family protein [Bacteroidota bacterium]